MTKNTKLPEFLNSRDYRGEFYKHIISEDMAKPKKSLSDTAEQLMVFELFVKNRIAFPELARLTGFST